MGKVNKLSKCLQVECVYLLSTKILEGATNFFAAAASGFWLGQITLSIPELLLFFGLSQQRRRRKPLFFEKKKKRGEEGSRKIGENLLGDMTHSKWNLANLSKIGGEKKR